MLRHAALAILAAATPLAAQTLQDLNSLKAEARHFVSSGLSSSGENRRTELYRIIGDPGPVSPGLLQRGVDVLHWQFQYKILEQNPGPGAMEAARHRQCWADCLRGVFNHFQYSDVMVTDARPIEHAWIAVSLDEAIAALKKEGYDHGFEKVTLMRPMHPALPDEFVYIFQCPVEKTKVAISTQTGALMWKESWN